MKKLINILVLISVLFFAGMKNINAQAHVTVSWTLSQSACHCHTLEDSIYSVKITIVDICAEPPSTIYEDTNIESGSTLSSDFLLNVDCDEFNNEQCYRVFASVTKLCPDGHGGYIIECEGQGSNPNSWSCSDFHNSNVNILVGPIVVE